MALDASIPLQGRPVQPVQVPNLIDQYSKAVGIQNAQAEIGFRQAEAQQNASRAKREDQEYSDKQRQLTGDKELGNQLAQNTTTDQQGNQVVDFQSAAKNLAAMGYGDHARQVLGMGAADQKARIEDQGKKVDQAIKVTGAVGQALGSIADAPPDQYAAAHDAKIKELTSAGILTPQQAQQYLSSSVIAQSQANGGPGDVSVLQQFDKQHLQAALTGQQQLTEHRADLTLAADLSDKKQKLLEGNIKTVGDVTKTAGQLLSQAKNQAQWDGIRQNLSQAGVPLPLLNNFGQIYSPEAAQQAGQSAMTPAERETSRHNVVEEAQGSARVATEQANTAIKQKEFEATFGTGANPALQGVEPKLRTPAMKDAQKAADDFATANKAADAMQSMIDMARSGNKAAGSNLPLVGVETLNALNGIKRINKSELDQYQGAGSLLDRIQGKIEKLAVGQPIPGDVMNDIESMHKTLREGAVKSYNDRLQGINQNYRSNFQPVKPSGAPSSSASSVPTPKSQSEYNALPKGAQFMKPGDSKVYVKQ